jgi:hypothetical protein
MFSPHHSIAVWSESGSKYQALSEHSLGSLVRSGNMTTVCNRILSSFDPTFPSATLHQRNSNHYTTNPYILGFIFGMFTSILIIFTHLDPLHHPHARCLTFPFSHPQCQAFCTKTSFYPVKMKVFRDSLVDPSAP